MEMTVDMLMLKSLLDAHTHLTLTYQMMPVMG